MKTKHRTPQQKSTLLSLLLMALFFVQLNAESKKDKTLMDDDANYISYQGIVKSLDSNEPLVFASIAVPGENTATVTNVEGRFTIKIAKNSQATRLHVSHIGYKSTLVELASLNKTKNVIRLEMATVKLSAVNIYPHEPEFLLRMAMQKRKENYSTAPNMMKGFYRESIKKNRSHVSIAEAVVLISKAPYLKIQNDQVKIYKGRKSEDATKLDTLVFRLKGGPATAMLFDIVKNPYQLLSDEMLQHYNFKYKNITEINGKPHFVIEFNQHKGDEFPLYNGKYYVSTDNLAIGSVEFSLNLEDPVAATNMLITKRPMGLKVTTKKVNYIVNYREQNGTWYFSHARAEMLFKLNWKRKLFNTNYSAIIEMAVTDRSEDNVVRFTRDEKFRQSDYLSKEVSLFGDPDFWGEHNTIEPDEAIQKTINKLKRKGKF